MVLSKIIIILIATFMVITLFVVMLYIIFKNKYNNKIKKYKLIIKDKFLTISIKSIQSQLKKLEVISSNNKSYKNIFSMFDDLYDKIDSKKSALQKKAKEFIISFKNSDQKEFLSEFNSDIDIIHNLIRTFNNKTNNIFRVGNFLMKEFDYYQERYKMIKQFYQQILIKIQPINKPLIDLNNEIIDLKNEFNNNHIASKIKECTYIILKYRNKIIEFGEILNNAPIIGDVIYNQIPDLIKKLKDHYNKTKYELNSPLDYINFIDSIKRIRDNYLILKKEYLKLNIKSCKFYIIWIYKNIKSLESLINDEIRAQKDFVLYYDVFVNKTKTIMRNYVIIQKQVKNLIKKNMIDEDSRAHFNQIKSLINEIDNNAINLMDSVDNVDIPFISKKFKLIQIFELDLSLIQMMNIMLLKIYNTNNAVLNFSNRLKYVSTIITDIYAKINIRNIKINENEIKQLDIIDYKIYSLEKYIFSSVIDYKKINNLFNDVEEKIGLIIQIIGTKNEAISICNNLLTKFASKRKLDKNFNYKMALSEKQYLSAYYIQALNTIITAIEGVK